MIELRKSTPQWDVQHFSDKSLWTMSVLHAVQLYNHIPSIGYNLSTLELWTKSKQSK